MTDITCALRSTESGPADIARPASPESRSIDSDPALSEALRRVIAAPALVLPPLPAEPAAHRRVISGRGW